MDEICHHLQLISNPKPSGSGCKECLAQGGSWLHLRRCLICGHIGCCDDSPNKHATRHAHESQHPLIQSYEPGEDWIWCYIDEVMFELPELKNSPSHPVTDKPNG